MSKLFSAIFPGKILPVRNGIYRTFDKDLNSWYYNQFKDGQWYWGYADLTRCQLNTNFIKMGQENVSKWYGLSRSLKGLK